MFKLTKIKLEIFGPLQTLFPSLKIDIFCRIVPLSFIKNSSKFNLKFLRPCKRWFSLWKSPFSDASPPYYLPMFPTNYAHMFPTNYAQTSPNRISPSRNSLCRENRIRGARAARMAGYAE